MSKFNYAAKVAGEVVYGTVDAKTRNRAVYALAVKHGEPIEVLLITEDSRR